MTEQIRLETFPGLFDVRITISPPRSGYGWLRARERQGVNYDEMVRVLEDCERNWRPMGDHQCGCDMCPHLGDCRMLFDKRCPKTPIDGIIEILRGGYKYKGKHLKKKGVK